MITTPEEFKAKLLEIQNKKTTFTTLPSTEPRFIIDANTREITIPSGFSFLGVKHDHKAETIYFEIDRYYDDVDLSLHTCIIQFTNGTGAEISEGIDHATEFDLVTVDGKIIFGWEIKNDVTRYAGNVLFSVRFFSIDSYNGTFLYNFNTTSKTLKILDTLEVIDGHTSIEPSILVYWEDRMDELNRAIASDISRYTAEMIALSETTKTYSDETKLLHNEVLNIKNDIPVSLANGIAEITKATESAKTDIAKKAVESLATIPEEYIQIDADVKVLKKQDIRNSARFSNALIGKASGTGLITVNDSAESAIPNLEVFGNSERVTTTGAQLIPYPYTNADSTYDGITVKSTNGHIKISGTNTIGTNMFITKDIPSGTYIIKMKGYHVGSTLRVHDSTDGIILLDILSSQDNTEVISKSFIVQEGHTVSLYFNISIANTIVNVDVDIMMTTIGNINSSYEPYTGGLPSPSPDYPQEIKSIGDSGKLDLMVTGANLCPDVSTWKLEGGAYIDNDGYIVLPRNGSMAETIVGWNKRSNGLRIDFDIFSAVSDNAFLISTLYLNSDLTLVDKAHAGNGASAKIANRRMNNKFGGDSPSNKPYSDAILNSVKIRVQVKYDSNHSIGEYKFKNVFSNSINETVPYEPYRSQSISIPLTEPLCGIPVKTDGNYTDASGQQWITDEIDLERGVYVQNISKLICNGSEAWTKSGSLGLQFELFITQSDAVKSSNYICWMCNIVQSMVYGYVYYKDKYNVSFTSSGISIIVNLLDAMELNDWKAFLASQNMVFLYARKEPIVTSLQADLKSQLNALTTYQGTTNIMIVGENPDMAVEYVQDINMVVKGLVDRIAVLEENLLT